MRKRDQSTTDIFIGGLRDATTRSRFQITTDSFRPYKYAIPKILCDRFDFGILIKVCNAASEREARRNPAEVSSGCPACGI
jgi:hypothetical protein